LWFFFLFRVGPNQIPDPTPWATVASDQVPLWGQNSSVVRPSAYLKVGLHKRFAKRYKDLSVCGDVEIALSVRIFVVFHILWLACATKGIQSLFVSLHLMRIGSRRQYQLAVGYVFGPLCCGTAWNFCPNCRIRRSNYKF